MDDRPDEYQRPDSNRFPHGDVTDEELNEILAAHLRWLESDGKEGQRADLSGVSGLTVGRLAGANLAGAKMPSAMGEFRELKHVDAAVSIIRPLYLVLLIVCMYSVMIVFSTDDPSLIRNSPIQLIPETALGVPIVSFYMTVPILVLVFYVYLHLYLYRVWQILGSLPSVFHDGTPLDEATSPWLPTAWVRFYQPHGVRKPLLLGHLQKYVTIILVWWVVPGTLVLLWARYLVRHDWGGTAFHIALVTVAIWSAVILYQAAVTNMRRELGAINLRRQLFTSIAVLPVTGALFVLLSLGTIEGKRGEVSIGDPRTWLPSALQLIEYDVFANLEEAEISIRPSNWWTAKNLHEVVIPANLAGADLRYAAVARAFLVRADLRHADLRGADLTGADVQRADLRFANLARATLWRTNLETANLANSNLQEADFNTANLENSNVGSADLRGAVLSYANLRGADLSNANLQRADLREANLKSADLSFANLEGAGLGLADMQGAKLIGAILKGADILGALLHGANLEVAEGLTQAQLDQACGNEETKLPNGLTVKGCPGWGE